MNWLFKENCLILINIEKKKSRKDIYMNFEFLGENLKDTEARQMNSLTLAFIGDAIYEVVVRMHVVKNNRSIKVNQAHRKVIDYVKATSQCKLMHKIEMFLDEDEKGVYKRGRNCKGVTAPKSANITEYRIATGFEALIGYLYLTGKFDRINELIEILFKEE